LGIGNKPLEILKFLDYNEGSETREGLFINIQFSERLEAANFIAFYFIFCYWCNPFNVLDTAIALTQATNSN